MHTYVYNTLYVYIHMFIIHKYLCIHTYVQIYTQVQIFLPDDWRWIGLFWESRSLCYEWSHSVTSRDAPDGSRYHAEVSQRIQTTLPQAEKDTDGNVQKKVQKMDVPNWVCNNW